MASFRGFPACDCLVEWLPVYERMLRHEGVLRPDESLRIYQLIGGADASAGTHSRGGAFDITDLVGEKDVWVARQMGADATWARTRAQGFVPHLHGVLRGCPHNGPARYQIGAVDDGFNGLGRGGRGGRDDGPRPLSGRTWRQGIEWAERQMEELDMDESKLRTIIREEVGKELAEHGLDELAGDEKARAVSNLRWRKEVRRRFNASDEDLDAIQAAVEQG